MLVRIERDLISFMPGPPTQLPTMLGHPGPKDFDISLLQATVTGAATVPPALIARMRDELGIASVTMAYGLTKCGGCAVCHSGDSVESVAGRDRSFAVQ